MLISKRAEEDLREIWWWSFEQFGEAQADRYLDQLEVELRQCGSHPGSGRRRDCVHSGCRSKVIHKHVAFYTVTDSDVVIQRVLHGSMDPELHVGPPKKTGQTGSLPARL